MARKYSKGAAKKVKRAMHKRKKGTLKSGRSGKTVKSQKQAIAIGLSEARKEGKRCPRRNLRKNPQRNPAKPERQHDRVDKARGHIRHHCIL